MITTTSDIMKLSCLGCKEKFSPFIADDLLVKVTLKQVPFPPSWYYCHPCIDAREYEELMMMKVNKADQ